MDENSGTPSPLRSRILWCVFSAGVGGILGAVMSEMMCFLMIGISVIPVLGYVFGGAFVVLAVALAIRIYRSIPERSHRIMMWLFSLLILASGIACFVLPGNWLVSLSWAAKTPLYMSIGVSLAFAMTFGFLELTTLAICAKCLSEINPDGGRNYYFSSPVQIFGLFGTAVLIGAIFGLIFGLTKVDATESVHNNLNAIALYGIPVGLVLGGAFGFANQWYRTLSQYTRIDDHVTAASHQDI